MSSRRTSMDIEHHGAAYLTWGWFCADVEIDMTRLSGQAARVLRRCRWALFRARASTATSRDSQKLSMCVYRRIVHPSMSAALQAHILRLGLRYTMCRLAG